MTSSRHNNWRSLQTSFAESTMPVTDLVRQCFNQIKERNDELIAFMATDEEGALAAAKAADERLARKATLSPIDGLPIAIKNNIAVKGWPTTAGIKAREHCIAEADAMVVRRLRDAGAIIIGRTNLHEAALGATTDNPWYGRTIHPAAPGFTAGGSSGGSACAVAASMAVAALGTDTMGSVRLPAGYCGLVGLKPSRGLVSIADVVPLAEQFDTVGPIANTIEDVRALMAILAGHDNACAVSVKPPSPLAFDQQQPVDLSTLRLWAPANLAALGAEPHVVDAIDNAVNELQGAGAVIDRSPLELNLSQLRYAGLLLVEREAADFHAPLRATHGHGFSRDLSAMLDYGLALPDDKLVDAQRTVDDLREWMKATLSTIDAIVLPTTLHTAFSFQQPVPADQADMTAFANLTGVPALSIPARGDYPLPIGLQLISRHFSDDWLLNLGAAVENVIS